MLVCSQLPSRATGNEFSGMDPDLFLQQYTGHIPSPAPAPGRRALQQKVKSPPRSPPPRPPPAPPAIATASVCHIYDSTGKAILPDPTPATTCNGCFNACYANTACWSYRLVVQV